MTGLYVFTFVLFCTPLGLLAWFELFALARRRNWPRLVTVATAFGGPVDLLCNYTWFRVLGTWPWAGLQWKQRTVTEHVTHLARQAVAAMGEGRLPTLPQAWALALALYLNARDAGHCEL